MIYTHIFYESFFPPCAPFFFPSTDIVNFEYHEVVLVVMRDYFTRV